jgi:hypothetical protein
MSSDTYAVFSALTSEEKLIKAKELRDEAWYANLSWLTEAELAHKFKAGDQWSDDEKRKLSLQGRSPMVWNYVHPAVELIMGIHSQNPVRIYPYPVEKNDAFLCSVLEDIVKYIDENQVDAKSQEDLMFESSVITGIGDVTVDVGPDPGNPEEIFLYENSLDSYEVLVDPTCKRNDLKDARHIFYEKWVTLSDFKMRYPKHIKDIEEIFTENASGVGKNISDIHSSSNNDTYTNPAPSFEYFDSQKNRILVTHMEYREAYRRYYYKNAEGLSTEIHQKQVSDMKKQAKEEGGSLIDVYDTKVRWMHYIHDRILWEGDSPVYAKDFSLCRQIAYLDRSKRLYSYYGVVKLMLDAQRECNRRWMHALRLLSSQGIGVMAEIDAFHSLEQAKDSWSDPDTITFMAKGGLNKVKEKTALQYPDAPMKLGAENRQAIKDITGINPDLQGIAQQRREPGINLKMRQQQGLTMLSKLFENHRKARREIYKRKVEIIVRYMPDAQIKRILGENENYVFQDGLIIDQQRQLQAPIRAIRDLTYNIRIEDAPGGMNKMMTELATFMDMMERKFPVNPSTVIDKLDLSPIEKAEWKAFIQQGQEQQQQAQQQQAQLMQEANKVKADEAAKKYEIENRRLDIMQDTQVQNDERIKVLESNKIALSDTVSKRDISVKLAELEASDKQNFVEILKWVQDKLALDYNTAKVPPTPRANTAVTG